LHCNNYEKLIFRQIVRLEILCRFGYPIGRRFPKDNAKVPMKVAIMKHPYIRILSTLGALCLATGSAMAATGESPPSGAGHWAWISEPIIGPKSTAANRRRIWVPDQPQPAVGPGHWQWITEFSVGPRSGPPLHHRVWVSDR
jgi:hypothetical protein